MPATPSYKLAKPTSAMLTEGQIYGLKEGQYVNDPQLILPHDAIRHRVPDGVQVIRATGERTYVLENYTPEEYDGNPASLTGMMPVDELAAPERGQRTRPGDRMRNIPDFSGESTRRADRKKMGATTDANAADEVESVASVADGLEL